MLIDHTNKRVLEVLEGRDKILIVKYLRQYKETRWLWQTNPDHLRDEQRQQLRELSERFPQLGQLLEQRDALRAIFEDPTITDAVTGAERLREWMMQVKQLGVKALDTFCQTLTNWLGQIANYFVWRSSNGRTEGYNHGLRAILWRAFGMQNFRHFHLRVLDRFGRPKQD